MSIWRRHEIPGAANRPDAARHDQARLLGELSRRYRAPLVNYFTKRLGTAEDPEPLVQETFVRLARRCALENAPFPEGYLFQVAASVVRDRLSNGSLGDSARDQTLGSGTTPSVSEEPRRDLQPKPLLDIVLAALAELPARTRQVFVLRRYEHMRHEEIAAHLRLTVGGVRSHLRRAKAHLARWIGRDP